MAVARKGLYSETGDDLGRIAQYWNGKDVSFPYNSRLFLSLKGKKVDVRYIIDTFKFRYLEFGNYVTQGERKKLFFGFAEGCLILSSNLFFYAYNLGLDSRISVAIGARGVGGKAVAHFEPNTMFINLTRDKGAHSFAHEYAHALDYFFGLYVDGNAKYSYLSGGGALGMSKENALYNKGGKLRSVVNRIVDEAINQMPKLNEYEDYWRRRTEVFARSFEAWVSWTMAQMAGKSQIQYQYENSYLVKPLSYYMKADVYPHDLKKLDPLFREFCRLSGRLMNGKSINETSSKSVAAMPLPRKKTKRAKK